MRSKLPRGGELPDDDWERRHRALTWLLFTLAIGFTGYTLTSGYSASHTALHIAGIAGFAILARQKGLGRRGQSLACSIGLLTAAALGVHMSSGVSESHFSFFIVVVVLALYEDWSVFLMAVGFVLVHHGVLGSLEPREVFDEPGRIAEPWRWAIIHALYVAAGGAAGVVTWGMNEDARRRTFETQEELRAAATTDSLTGLRNRRALMEDLEGTFGTRFARLALFDLNGFKHYNDTFGHLAGDALLARLGRRLEAATIGCDSGYRLGGDEFCVLTHGAGGPQAIQAAAVALSETGEAFSISSSYGTVELDSEAGKPEDALRIADERMYEHKNSGRRSAGDQSKAVLLRALAERHPELGEHVGSVAETAEAVARRLGAPADELEPIRQAAELHDVGKVAIPDAILSKPGPLSPDEWEFMRRHTLIGERIVAAAPSLGYVSRLVRASHERWDGDGYPDAIAGDAIPLGSRIVAVCDAFDAMVTDRPYSSSRTVEQALAELDRCAGSQFDPEVVQAFASVIGADHTPADQDFVATVASPAQTAPPGVKRPASAA